MALFFSASMPPSLGATCSYNSAINILEITEDRYILVTTLTTVHVILFFMKKHKVDIEKRLQIK